MLKLFKFFDIYILVLGIIYLHMAFIMGDIGWLFPLNQWQLVAIPVAIYVSFLILLAFWTISEMTSLLAAVVVFLIPLVALVIIQ